MVGPRMHLRPLAVYTCIVLACAPARLSAQARNVSLIIRTDDVGMSHSVNMGVQRLIATGLPLSVSVMFACPWYQEAVAILKQHPEDAPQYSAAPRQKGDSLVALIDRLKPGLNLVVTHVGIDDAELGALLDMNTDEPLPDMSKNRQGELDALTSQRFGAALKAHNIVLLTYRQVIAKEGLKSMRRPVG